MSAFSRLTSGIPDGDMTAWLHLNEMIMILECTWSWFFRCVSTVGLSDPLQTDSHHLSQPDQHHRSSTWFSPIKLLLLSMLKLKDIHGKQQFSRFDQDRFERSARPSVRPSPRVQLSGQSRRYQLLQRKVRADI